MFKKCKRCNAITPPLNLLRFDKNIYKAMTVTEATKEVIDRYHNKTVCMQCLHDLRDKICIDDFQIRKVEHLEVKDAHILNMKTLSQGHY